MSRKMTALQHSRVLYRQFEQTRKANERIRKLLAQRDVVFAHELSVARAWAKERPEHKVTPDDYARCVLATADYATQLGMSQVLQNILRTKP